MAFVEFGNVSVDMRLALGGDGDYGIPELRDLITFLDAFWPVREELLAYSPTSATIRLYDAVNAFVTARIDGDLNAGHVDTIQVEAAGVIERLVGEFNVNPFDGTVSGLAAEVSAVRSSDGGLLVSFSGLALPVQDLEVELPTDDVLLAGNDRISSGVGNDWLLGYAGDDQMFGNAGNDTLVAGGGHDSLSGGTGDDLFDGGSGLDSVLYDGVRAGYQLTIEQGNPVTSVSFADGADSFSGIERLLFADLAMGFDIEGAAGQAYRIYKAAFDRAPDAAGLGYWIAQLDTGESLLNVATGFVGSDEFADLYGANPTNEEYTLALYLNVLDREPDEAGYAYWNARLSNEPWNGIPVPEITREQMLVDFSESAENQDNVIGLIGNGIDYLPWG